jgi:Domain of unknown function (DUF4833)
MKGTRLVTTAPGWRLLAAALGLGLGLATPARAAPPVTFGPHDVPTVFAISKSDDGNQVQYGLRLDADCRPVGPEPVVGYWREYDKGPAAPLVPFSWLDRTAYGIESQGVSPPGSKGPAVAMNIRATPNRLIDIWVHREADGTCRAEPRATISGRRAVLKLIYVKLSGIFVNWVEIRGVALDDGTPVTERVRV